MITTSLNALITAERLNLRNDVPLLPLGLHFGLDEDRYYADPAIGSTQIRQLARNPQAYWSDSWMNPRRIPHHSTLSQVRGTALHQLVYFGVDYFNDHYLCGADQKGLSQGEKSANTKRANKLADAVGKIALKFDDYERVMIAAAMIVKNPELAGVFASGKPEISLFWQTDDGIRCKARMDYIKHRRFDNVAGIGELKSNANPFELDFHESCRHAIGRYAYDEQASWYMDAAAHWIPRHVADGAVYGSDYNAEWLDLLASATSWAWQWVFAGIEGPPLTWSAILSPENPIVADARRMNELGLANYRKFLAHYGTEQWLLIETPRELMLEEMPAWFRR